MSQVLLKNGQVNLDGGGVLIRPTPVPVVPWADTKSMVFNGTTQAVSAVHDASLNPNNITISAWMRITAHKNYNFLIAKITSNSALAYSFFVASNGTLYMGGNNIAPTMTATGLSTGTWYHVVATISSTNGYLYVNNVQRSTASISNGGLYVNTADVVIGYDPFNNSTRYFNGNIDEVAIFNSALSAPQVAELYNGGCPADLSEHSAYGNLVSWWRMGDDATWDGIRWIVPDQTLTNTCSSTRMTIGSVVTAVPC